MIQFYYYSITRRNFDSSAAIVIVCCLRMNHPTASFCSHFLRPLLHAWTLDLRVDTSNLQRSSSTALCTHQHNQQTYVTINYEYGSVWGVHLPETHNHCEARFVLHAEAIEQSIHTVNILCVTRMSSLTHLRSLCRMQNTTKYSY